MILSHKEYLNRLASVITSFNPKGTFLDIGCGAGDMLIRISGDCMSVFGVDISIDYLKEGKQFGVNGLCYSQAEDLPFRSEQFDLILIHHVIEHLQNDRKAVSEIRRCIKKGGIVIAIGTVPKLLPLKVWQGFGLLRNPDHINQKPEKYWIRLFQEFNMEYRGSLQHLVRQDYPNHKGRHLLRFGVLGHLLCEAISTIIRGSYIFEAL